VHGLILAGGEGARLSAEGVGVPKPLVEVGGEPLVVRLLGLLASLGCESITCMVRADLTAVFRLLQGREFGPPLAVRPCITPSSMHTLAEGLKAVPAGPVFCTMVDTVMPAAHWRDVYAETARGLAGGADAMLAVTPFVDDESPLYVSTDGAGFVRALSDVPIPLAPARVTGGVYGFSTAARQAAGEAVGQGVQRMRGFLKWLVARGSRVGTITVPRIIDIDHESDLRLANAWLGSPEAQA
jgi:NDP-sugar pyrophosphorylase family protein